MAWARARARVALRDTIQRRTTLWLRLTRFAVTGRGFPRMGFSSSATASRTTRSSGSERSKFAKFARLRCSLVGRRTASCLIVGSRCAAGRVALFAFGRQAASRCRVVWLVVCGWPSCGFVFGSSGRVAWRGGRRTDYCANVGGVAVRYPEKYGNVHVLGGPFHVMKEMLHCISRVFARAVLRYVTKRFLLMH